MPSGSRSRSLTDAALRAALDDVRARCDTKARLAADPVGAVHAFEDPLDQELVALLAAALAFGNVKTIRQKLGEALTRIGPIPTRAADDEASLRAHLDGWVHRVFRGEDIASLLVGARLVQREHGSLGALFEALFAEHGEVRAALALWCDAVRRAGKLPFPREKSARRGPFHVLPNPRGPSASKRLLLFLRWMIRPSDGVDLGLWDVPTRALLCPVDTHIHKLGRNLGFTDRNDLSWKTAEEITRALARLDEGDPVKYDFSLCHLGMLQRCPSRRDEKRCEGCAVMPLCRHWRSTKQTRAEKKS